MMKFSHRIFIITGFVFICAAAVLWWGSKQTIFLPKRQVGIDPDKLVDSHIWPMRVNPNGQSKINNVASGKNITPQVLNAGSQDQASIFDTDTCAFGALGDAQSDYRTLDLFQEVDRNFGENVHKEVHMGVPASNDDELVITKDRSRKLRVFVVPNSHNDPGWHKTVDGYFDDQTHPMLDAMVEKLEKYPKMTFVWAESVFLDLWWRNLDASRQQKVRDLIQRKQLEVVVGSWVVPDEANPTYYALIDQMIHGHQWLEHRLGVKPNNTWSLDPFGYSSSLPQLYRAAGYQHMLILRVHKDLKELLQHQQALEFRWRQHWDLSGATDILTHMMPYKLYNIKHTCGPDQHICLQFDFRKIPGETSESRAETIHAGNVERQAKKLLGQYYKKAKLFRHNVLLVPIGDDFRFDRPIEWDQQFKNYQMLFNYMNDKPDWNVKAQFGTLQDYFDAVHEEMKATDFPVLTGDFFPYTDQHDEFWTGYFTTRPWDKVVGRQLEFYLRAADLLHSYALMGAQLQQQHPYREVDNAMAALDDGHASLGLFQHHDAVTGTERRYVAMDYEQRLLRTVSSSQRVSEKAAQYLMTSSPQDTLTLSVDDATSMRLVTTENKVLDVTAMGTRVVLHNTVAHRCTHPVRLLVNRGDVAVFTPTGEPIPSQLEPYWANAADIDHQKFQILILLELEPLATGTIVIKQVDKPEMYKNTAATITLHNTEGGSHISLTSRFQVLPPVDNYITLENPVYRVRFSQHLGFMHSITTKTSILSNNVNLQFLMYRSRGSGAYIFFPSGPAVDTELSNKPVVRVVSGPLAASVTSVQALVQHTATLYNTTTALGAAVDIANLVDLQQMNDKEIIMRFSTDVGADHDFFFSDLNSLSMRRRQLFKHYPQQANYYPLNSVAYLEDTSSRLTILSGQPHGVASLKPGQIEVMLDRRLTYDDNRGLGEGVTDNKVTPSRFMLVLERTKERGAQHNTQETSHPSLLVHTLLHQLTHPAIPFHTHNASQAGPLKFPFTLESLPCDVRLVSMRPLEPPTDSRDYVVAVILHRVPTQCTLACPVELSCKSTSSPMTLGSILPKITVKQVKEMTLSLMYEKRAVKLDDVIHLKPLDFIAFKIYF